MYSLSFMFLYISFIFYILFHIFKYCYLAFCVAAAGMNRRNGYSDHRLLLCT